MVGAVEAAVPDDAIAVINGQPVSRAAFGEALVCALGRNAIDTLVDAVLVEQEARRKGIGITEEELSDRKRLEVELYMRRAFESARMTPEEFRAAAPKYGWDEAATRAEFEKAIVPHLLRTQLLVEKLLRPHIEIRDRDVRRYYEWTMGDRCAAAHIAVGNRRMAEVLIETLSDRPEAWTDALIQFSLDRASVPHKGRMIPVPASSELGEALQGMRPGELRLYSDGRRWHVLRLAARIPPAQQSFEEVKDALREELYCRRVLDVAGLWLAELHARATVVANLSADLGARRALGADVAAFVNGETVERSRLAEALIAQFGKDLLGSYIERELVFREARRKGVTVSEETLAQRQKDHAEALFAEHAAERGMSADRFVASLAAGGISPEVYKQELIREFASPEDVRAGLLAEQMVSPGVEVTEEDIERAYRDLHGERLDVRCIILDNAPEAQQVHRSAAYGASFALLVRTRSTEPFAWLNKGIVRNITAKHPYFEHVKGLQEGEVSDVFRRQGKYHVLKLIARHLPTSPPPLDSVRDAIRKQVRLEKTQSRIGAWLVKLMAESQIEVRLK